MINYPEYNITYLSRKIPQQRYTIGISATNDDLTTKQRVLDYLGITVNLLVEDGKQVAYVHFELGPDHDRRLSRNGKSTTICTSFRRP